MQHPPIFIVGMPRSGTTLLASMLSAHSRIAICPETHYFDRYWKKCVRQDCLSNPVARRTYVEGFLADPGLSAFGFGDSEKEQLRKSMLSAAGHGAILSALLEAYAQRQGKDIAGEKTPGHIWYVERILETYPEARIVAMIRDPRDTILSLEALPWHYYGFLDSVAQWRSAARRVRAVACAGGLSLRFEDLITAPQRELKRICTFIGVGYEAHMLDHREAANFDPKTEPWKRNVLAPLDPSNQGKWRTRMPKRKLAAVDAALTAELIAWNYPTAGLPDPSFGDSVVLGIERWRFRAGRALRRVRRGLSEVG